MSVNVRTNAEFFQRLGVTLEDNSRKIFPVPDDNRSPLFALIIGINAYQHVKPLRGAVADALAFKQYLQDHLSIPEQNINILLDQQATRKNITDAFQSLQEDERIENKDPIVIYYAGHGSTLPAPKDWEAGGTHIQALVPQDVNVADASGNLIVAIPDRTIAILLNNLAYAKGNNITVIFDCCYAASGTRTEQEVEVPYRAARAVSAKDLPTIPSNVDPDIPDKHRAPVVSKDFALRGLRSHVLLAACASDESAYETNGRGDFTTALIRILVNSGADKLTYAGCIQKIPSLPDQRPQCEGNLESVNRVFFNAKISGTNRMFITVEREDNICFLNAGVAQGITVGSVFDIYPDHVGHENNRRLGAMRVVEVNPLKSTLDWENNEETFDLPNLSYGYQTKCGAGQDMLIYFTDAFVQSINKRDGPEWIKAFTANEQSIVFKLSDAETAQFIVDLDEKGEVVFETRHKLSNDNGLRRLPHSVPNTVQDVLVVLRSAALWTWHLERTNHEHPFERDIQIDLTRVVWDGFDENFKRRHKADDVNLNVSGVTDIVAKQNKYYGMKIWNKTPRNLHAYLFYFNSSTQAIVPWVVSGRRGSRGEANLPANSSFTIGYGSGGQPALYFVIEEGQELEVGVLKLFVTTSEGEFSTVDHKSPFEVVNEKRGDVTDTDVAQQLALRVDWDTFEITLVQRRDTDV